MFSVTSHSIDMCSYFIQTLMRDRTVAQLKWYYLILQHVSHESWCDGNHKQGQEEN